MISKEQLQELSQFYDDKERMKSDYERAEKVFQKEQQILRRLIQEGETTGDKIQDWALSKEFPYQKRLEKALEIRDYLSVYQGDIFVFLDLNNSDGYSWNLHIGKIASPFLSYTPGENLKLVVEEGTLIHKKLVGINNCSLMKPYNETLPFIEGLIIEPYENNDGILKSSHGLFSMDDHHYVLAAGEKNVLAYLHKRKVITEANMEDLDRILLG